MKTSLKIFVIVQICFFAGSCGSDKKNNEQSQKLKTQIEVDSIIISHLSKIKSPCTDCLTSAQNNYINCVNSAGSNEAAKKTCLDNLNTALAKCNAGPCPGKENKSTEKNLTIVSGTSLPVANESDIKKIKNITTDFTVKNLICGFLHINGNNYNVTVTATESKCFTWVFSKDGKVTALQSIQAQRGQSYNAYSSDGITIVGISCNCYF